MKRTGGAREEVGGRFVGNRELCGEGREVAGAHSQMRRRGGVRKKRTACLDLARRLDVLKPFLELIATMVRLGM